MQAPRIKISVSLPSDLVARLDRAAKAEARSRSRVLETWLRAAAREGAARDLEAATVAYYTRLNAEDRREEAAIATASSAAARRLDVDGARRSRARRKK
jgi:metal-responsive CopG/Arc/MetJ family transcriptional regulator